MRKQATVTVVLQLLSEVDDSSSARQAQQLYHLVAYARYSCTVIIYICYSPAWRSISDETVPEVLSTVDQGHTFFQIIWTPLLKLVNNIDISFFLENECKKRMK